MTSKRHTAAARRALPAADYALPLTAIKSPALRAKVRKARDAGAFPMDSRGRGANARSRAIQMLNKGYLSLGEARTIFARTTRRHNFNERVIDRLGPGQYKSRIVGKRRLRGAANREDIAQAILEQLGGAGRLVAMTGANTFLGHPTGVSFKFPNRGRGKPNYVKILLTPLDTYSLEFGRIRGLNYKVVKAIEGLHAEDLRPTFELQTGLRVSLGTMGRSSRGTAGAGWRVEEHPHRVQVRVDDLDMDQFDGITLTDFEDPDTANQEVDLAYLLSVSRRVGAFAYLSARDLAEIKASFVTYNETRNPEGRKLLTRAKGRAARRSRGRGALFTQPADVPVRKAKDIALIVNTNGSGTAEVWARMDAWAAAQGLRAVLTTVKRIYEANGSTWSTGEQNWWITQLTPEDTTPKGRGARDPEAYYRELLASFKREHAPTLADEHTSGTTIVELAEEAEWNAESANRYGAPEAAKQWGVLVIQIKALAAILGRGGGRAARDHRMFLSQLERYRLCDDLTDSELQEAALYAEAFVRPQDRPPALSKCDEARHHLLVTDGNKKRAAARMGVSRSTFYQHLQDCPPATRGRAARARSKKVEAAVVAWQKYAGALSASPRVQQRLFDRATKLTLAVAKHYAADPHNVHDQIAGEASSRGPRTPLAGKDY